MKASDNPFPSLLIEEAVDPAAPSAGHQRLFIDTDHKLKAIDSASAVVDYTPTAAITEITDIATAEDDDTLVLAPDGLGGVEFRAEAGGGIADEGAFTYLDATDAAAPANPASGYARIYSKSGRIYSRDSAGTEYGPFDAAGGGGGDPATISGGTETSSGGYDFHTFTASGTLTVSAAGVVDVLIVGGGGGGGGYFSGGGGGGGGVVHLEDFPVTADVDIVVGAGGTAGAAASGIAASGLIGGHSAFGPVAAVGGGGGGGVTTLSDQVIHQRNGANGGGGGARNTFPGGTGFTPQGGYAGGDSRTGTTSGTGAGGGGGGGGAAGADAGGSNNGAAGGIGVNVPDFDGFDVDGYWAGGGGGGGVDAAGAGGTGGGGHGGATSANTGMTAGTANSGGGGGGGGNTSTTGAVGGAGGSGIVIVRVPTP